MVKRAGADFAGVMAGDGQADVAARRHRDGLRAERSPARSIERVVRCKRAAAADQLQPARRIVSAQVVVDRTPPGQGPALEGHAVAWRAEDRSVLGTAV